MARLYKNCQSHNPEHYMIAYTRLALRKLASGELDIKHQLRQFASAGVMCDTHDTKYAKAANELEEDGVACLSVLDDVTDFAEMLDQVVQSAPECKPPKQAAEACLAVAKQCLAYTQDILDSLDEWVDDWPLDYRWFFDKKGVFRSREVQKTKSAMTDKKGLGLLINDCMSFIERCREGDGHDLLRSLYQTGEVPLFCQRTMGGFAASGLPSSFHHKYIREMRAHVFPHAKKLFVEFLKARGEDPDEWYVEMLSDRVLHRYKGQAPSKEPGHRDVTPTKGTNLNENDILFGGFLNLNKPDVLHKFSCCKGSHYDEQGEFLMPWTVAQKNSGFAKLSKTDLKKFRMSYVDVRSGEWCVFPQTLAHQVNATEHTGSYVMRRLFFGFRLTKDHGKGIKTLFPDKLERVQSMRSMQLPSGQESALYGQNHNTIFKVRHVIPWAATLESNLMTFPNDKVPGYSFKGGDLFQANRTNLMLKNKYQLDDVPGVWSGGLQQVRDKMNADVQAFFENYTQKELEIHVNPISLKRKRDT